MNEFGSRAAPRFTSSCSNATKKAAFAAFLRGEFLLKQRFDHLRDVGHGDELYFVLEFFAGLHVFGGQNHALEAHFEAFVHAALGKIYAADFARQTHFPENCREFLYGDHLLRRGEGGADGKVGAGFVQTDAAHGVQVNILHSERQAAPLFENGDEHDEAVQIDPQGHSAGKAVVRLCHERLDLHHHAAVARLARRDDGARRDAAAVR